MLTIGSLFSGVDGLVVGLERAGLGPVRWQCEIAPYCRAVLAERYPAAHCYDTIERAGVAYGPVVPLVDLVCGGFPCPPASVAGLRRGRADERWLWPHFARVVRALRPTFVVAENVAGLRTVEGGRAFAEVLGDLAACGYRVGWLDLHAADVGAPHKRERIFVVAWRVPDSNGRGLRQRAERGHGAPRPADAWHGELVDVVASCLGDADGARPQGRLSEQAEGRTGPRARSGEVADADGRRREGERVEEHDDLGGAPGREPHRCSACGRWPWPPPPNDTDGWREWLACGGPTPAVEHEGLRVRRELRAESELRRGADGSPARLDAAARADARDRRRRARDHEAIRRARLHALGNAVVPDCAEAVGWIVRRIAER